MSKEDPAGDKTTRSRGWLLVCVGALFLTLSGLCTLGYSGGEVTAPQYGPTGALNIFTGPGMLIFVIPFRPSTYGYWAGADPVGSKGLEAREVNDPPVMKLFGGLLIAAGVLIATLSGLCSLAVLGILIGPGARGPGAMMRLVPNLGKELQVVAIFGGLPFLFGLALVAGGCVMMFRAAAPLPVARRSG